MIALDYEIEVPNGGTVSFGIAHLHEGGYAGVSSSCSWDQGSIATITYWCYWSDLNQFIKAIVGDNDVVPEGAGNRYSRFLPHRYPISALPNLYGTKIVDIKGIPGESTENDIITTYPRFSNDGLSYRYAAVVAQYEPLPFPLLNDNQTPWDEEWRRFTSITKAPRLEFLNTKIAAYKWLSDQTPLDTGIFIREQSVDYIVTHHRVPEAFFNPASYIGYANLEDGFLAGHPQVPTAGFSANTMCLMGVQEVVKAVAFTDNLLYDYIYFFKYQPNGFHKTKRITAASFDYAEFSLDGTTPAAGTAGNGKRLVPLTDLAVLFQPNV